MARLHNTHRSQLDVIQDELMYSSYISGSASTINISRALHLYGNEFEFRVTVNSRYLDGLGTVSH